MVELPISDYLNHYTASPYVSFFYWVAADSIGTVYGPESIYTANEPSYSNSALVTDGSGNLYAFWFNSSNYGFFSASANMTTWTTPEEWDSIAYTGVSAQYISSLNGVGLIYGTPESTVKYNFIGIGWQGTTSTVSGSYPTFVGAQIGPWYSQGNIYTLSANTTTGVIAMNYSADGGATWTAVTSGQPTSTTTSGFVGATGYYNSGNGIIYVGYYASNTSINIMPFTCSQYGGSWGTAKGALTLASSASGSTPHFLQIAVASDINIVALFDYYYSSSYTHATGYAKWTGTWSAVAPLYTAANSYPIGIAVDVSTPNIFSMLYQYSSTCAVRTWNGTALATAVSVSTAIYATSNTAPSNVISFVMDGTNYIGVGLISSTSPYHLYLYYWASATSPTGITSSAISTVNSSVIPPLYTNTNICSFAYDGARYLYCYWFGAASSTGFSAVTSNKSTWSGLSDWGPLSVVGKGLSAGYISTSGPGIFYNNNGTLTYDGPIYTFFTITTSAGSVKAATTSLSVLTSVVVNVTTSTYPKTSTTTITIKIGSKISVTAGSVIPTTTTVTLLGGAVVFVTTTAEVEAAKHTTLNVIDKVSVTSPAIHASTTTLTSQFYIYVITATTELPSLEETIVIPKEGHTLLIDAGVVTLATTRVTWNTFTMGISAGKLVTKTTVVTDKYIWYLSAPTVIAEPTTVNSAVIWTWPLNAASISIKPTSVFIAVGMGVFPNAGSITIKPTTVIWNFTAFINAGNAIAIAPVATPTFAYSITTTSNVIIKTTSTSLKFISFISAEIVSPKRTTVLIGLGVLVQVTASTISALAPKVTSYMLYQPPLGARTRLEAHAKDGTLLGIIWDAYNIQYTGQINSISQLTFTIQAQSTSRQYINEKNEIWLYGLDGQFFDCFVIEIIEDERNQEVTETAVTCMQVAQYCTRYMIPTEYAVYARMTSDCIYDFASLMEETEVTTCEIDANLDFPITITIDSQNYWQSFMAIRQQCGGYVTLQCDPNTPTMRTLMFSEYLGNDMGQEVRYGKNVTQLTRTQDATKVITKLWATGAGSGINQTTLDGCIITDTAPIASFDGNMLIGYQRCAPTTQNLLSVQQANCVDGITGLVAGGSSGATISQDTTTGALPGTDSAMVTTSTTTSAPSGYLMISTTNIPVMTNTEYTASVSVQSNYTTIGVISLAYYTSGGAYIPTPDTSIPTYLTDMYRRMVVTATSPANASYAVISVISSAPTLVTVPTYIYGNLAGNFTGVGAGYQLWWSTAQLEIGTAASVWTAPGISDGGTVPSQLAASGVTSSSACTLTWDLATTGPITGMHSVKVTNTYTGTQGLYAYTTSSWLPFVLAGNNYVYSFYTKATMGSYTNTKPIVSWQWKDSSANTISSGSTTLTTNMSASWNQFMVNMGVSPANAVNVYIQVQVNGFAPNNVWWLSCCQLEESDGDESLQFYNTGNCYLQLSGEFNAYYGYTGQGNPVPTDSIDLSTTHIAVSGGELEASKFDEGDNTVNTIGGMSYEGQTFVAPWTGRVSSIDLKIYISNQSSTADGLLAPVLSGLETMLNTAGLPALEVCLYDTQQVQGVTWPSTEIETVCVTSASITAWQDANNYTEWCTFDFDSSTILNDGQTYAIIVKNSPILWTEMSDIANWCADNSNPGYADGYRIYSSDAGITWNADPTTDYMFRVTVCSVADAGWVQGQNERIIQTPIDQLAGQVPQMIRYRHAPYLVDWGRIDEYGPIDGYYNISSVSDADALQLVGSVYLMENAGTEITYTLDGVDLYNIDPIKYQFEQVLLGSVYHVYDDILNIDVLTSVTKYQKTFDQPDNMLVELSTTYPSWTDAMFGLTKAGAGHESVCTRGNCYAQLLDGG